MREDKFPFIQDFDFTHESYVYKHDTIEYMSIKQYIPYFLSECISDLQDEHYYKNAN